MTRHVYNHRYYVLCQSHKGAEIQTYLPVFARDPKHAAKKAKGAGLVPYGVIEGK